MEDHEAKPLIQQTTTLEEEEVNNNCQNSDKEGEIIDIPNDHDGEGSTNKADIEETPRKRDVRLTRRPKAEIDVVFFWESDYDEYMENHKYDEAYGVLDRKNRLGLELRNAAFHLNYAVTLLATDRTLEYTEVKEKLLHLLKQQVMPNRDKMVKLANGFDEKQNYLAALVVLDMSVDMFWDNSNPYTTIAFTELCMQGMKNSISEATKKQEKMQHFLAQSFLPRMRILRERIDNLEGVNDGYKCVKLAWLTHCVEVCDPNDETTLILLRDTVKRMKEVLGSRAYEYQIYGTLCNNLGAHYFKLDRNEEAISSYNEALKCFNAAKDFEVEGKKQMFIIGTSRALRRAQGIPNREDIADVAQRIRERHMKEVPCTQS